MKPNDNLVVSPTEPQGLNRKKVWIQNTDTEQKMYLLNDNNVYEEVINTKLEQKVDKVSGKGLSTNDFTSAYKTKLDGIATGATKNTVENSLTSASTTNALSANQGKVLNEKIIGTTLYSNSTGITGTNTITLNKSISNFKRLKVVYDTCSESGSKFAYGSIKEFDVTGKLTDFLISEVVNVGVYATFSLTGTTLTITRNRKTNSAGIVENGNWIYITKVIGYTV